MYRLLWSMTKVSVPVELPLLIYGAIFGVAIGLLTLATGSSVDKATALGIATVIELALGIWLGRWAWLLWLRVVGRVHDQHRARIRTLEAKIAQALDVSNVCARHSKVQTGFWGKVRSLLMRFLFFPPVLMIYGGMTLLSVAGIDAIIDLNVDIHETPLYRTSLVVGAMALLIGLIIQAIEVCVIDYRLRRLERDVENLTSTPDLVSQSSILWDAYRFTQRWIFILLAWDRTPRVTG